MLAFLVVIAASIGGTILGVLAGLAILVYCAIYFGSIAVMIWRKYRNGGV